MSTTETGQRAEAAATDYLQVQGYTILERNWKTRWCEIDIIARKEDVVYCVEVKYRATNAWGDGLDYITPAKLRQMGFAADLYMSRKDEDWCLAAMAINRAGDIHFIILESY